MQCHAGDEDAPIVKARNWATAGNSGGRDRLGPVHLASVVPGIGENGENREDLG